MHIHKWLNAFQPLLDALISTGKILLEYARISTVFRWATNLGKGLWSIFHFFLVFFFFFAQRPSRKYLINILSKTYEFRGPSFTFKAKTHRPLRTATHGKNVRGGSGRCQVCRRLEPGTTLTSHITRKKYSNNCELDCNSNNVVYLISLRCIRYSAWSTMTKFRFRFNNHRSRLDSY